MSVDDRPEGAVPRDRDRDHEPAPQPDLPPDEATSGEADEPAGDDDGMSFLDHLDELRTVIIRSSLAAIAAAVLCWFWSADLLDLLVRPLAGTGVYFTAPNEAFLVRLKLAGIVGVFLVLPFILWQIYGFVLPGLYRTERRVVTPLIVATTLLFYLGVVFSFLVVSPMVIRFLMSFGTEIMQPLIGVGNYFAFVARLSLAFGLIFELPVLVFFLSVAGILEPRMLLRTWRYALVIIVILAAVLTPPDIFSQVAMAIPVSILYLASILAAMAATRGRDRDETTDEDE